MNKFHGPVGYVQNIETKPGVWSEKVIERPYYGDVIKSRLNMQLSSETINTNVTTTIQISIIADPYANDNFHAIRYVTWMGKKWRVVNIDISYPRIILQLGGIYNG